MEHSYYMGGYYRVYGRMEGEKGVYFNSEKALEAGENIFLNVSLETINKRLPI